MQRRQGRQGRRRLTATRRVSSRPTDRSLYAEEHELFRKSFRTFLEREVVPHQLRWIEAGIVDREVWRKAGEAGFLGPWLDPDLGGAGGDFLHSCIVIEELCRIYESGFAMPLHSDVIVPYIHEFGTGEQKKRWLPGCASGELVTGTNEIMKTIAAKQMEL